MNMTDNLHPGENMEIINSYHVYVGGTWYEISERDGRGVIHSGNCAPGMTPRQVYDHHFSDKATITEEK